MIVSFNDLLMTLTALFRVAYSVNSNYPCLLVCRSLVLLATECKLDTRDASVAYLFSSLSARSVAADKGI